MTHTKLIDVFYEHINKLNIGNLVIGGIHALKLHGLVLHREPVDFDVVIYGPTSEQEDYLFSLLESGVAINDDDLYDEDTKSFKITIDGHIIDFLVERKQNVPQNLLCLVHRSQQFFVQSVENVIESKRSYFDGYEYRPKDEDDCKILRELNFDLHKHKKPVNWEEMAKQSEDSLKDDLPF